MNTMEIYEVIPITFDAPSHVESVTVLERVK